MVKGKYINFIKSNIRYSKYQIFVVAFLFVIAAALINTFLFVSFNYKNSFAVEKDRLNGEDIDLLYFDNDPRIPKDEMLSGVLSDIPEVKDFEVDNVISTMGTFNFKDGRLFQNSTYLSFSDALEKKIGKYDIIENDGGSGAFLSYLFKVDGGYETGDEIQVTLGVREDTFRIAGFYNSVDTGTSNCTDTVFLLTDDCYDEVSECGLRGYRISILLDEPEKGDVLESQIAHKIGDEVSGLSLLGSSSAVKLSTSRYITSTLFETIISTTSVLMIIVILAIIAITLSNYLRNNMKNLGTLKALGYKSNNLIVPIVVEFSVIAFVMSVVGVAVSYLILPLLNTELEKQVGIPYNISFMFTEALISVAICVIAAAVSSLLSVTGIKHIAPIQAIRDSSKKKSAKRNYFSLDKTRFALNTALSLKTWISAKARNIVILLSITGISFLIGFSCFIYQNVVIDSSQIMSLVFGNMTDSKLNVYTANEDKLIEAIKSNDSVERGYMFSVKTVTPEGFPKMYAYVFDDRDDLDEERICVEGHLPVNKTEIAVNKAYANRTGVKTGDTLSFTEKGKTSEFTVCGLVQGAFYSGYECYILRDGYSEIMPLINISYYVDLKEGTDIDEFNSDVASECDLMYYINYKESADTVSKSYKNILSVATVIVVIVSVMIAAFILYVLVSVYLSNKKRDHGILKSLGFLTKDIIFQTVVSFIPTSIAATVIGLLLSRKGAALLLIMAVKNIGIFTFGRPTSVLLLLIAGAAIILFTIAYSVILSNSVRRITPHQLFSNE